MVGQGYNNKKSILFVAFGLAAVTASAQAVDAAVADTVAQQSPEQAEVVVPPVPTPLDIANEAYATYVKEIQGPNRIAGFDALYTAYNLNIELLTASLKGTEEYEQCRRNLLKMWPQLQLAAVSYDSRKQTAKAVYMAQAYLTMPGRSEFMGENFAESKNKASLAYYVGSYFFNAKAYDKAIPFLNEYLKSGEEKNRKNVFLCMCTACREIGDVATGRRVIDEAARCFPTDVAILNTAIKYCQEMRDNEGVQRYLDRALYVNPDDETLLRIQGKLHEENFEFAKAQTVYQKLQTLVPSDIEMTKHVALNIYNQGVFYANKSIAETDSKQKKNELKLAKDYFAQAELALANVLMVEPQSVKYNTALAVAYGQLGKTAKLKEVNAKLVGLGAGYVVADAVPQLITFAGGGSSSSSFDALGGQSETAANTGSYNPNAPTFSSYARRLIEAEISKWQQKDPYETVSEYQARVTEATRSDKIREVKKRYEAEYITAYGGTLTTQGFSLRPYDADNGVFLIDSPLGQLVLPVPRTNDEARQFEKNWNGIGLKDAQYYIANDRLALSSVVFVTPTGKNYQFKADQNLTYQETNVDINLDPIKVEDLAGTMVSGHTKVEKMKISLGKSDVDMNIPETGEGDNKTFVLIIANEEYNYVSKVPFTSNDGTTFSDYCKKTFGIPASNIHVLTNATYNDMRRQVNWLVKTLEAFKGEGRAIVYYAGHGIPDEATRSAYILPVDGDGSDVSTGLSLSNLYNQLGSVPSRGVIVLLDACFSGATREGSMLASARGVSIKAKAEVPKSQIVVLSAATDDETAWPYKEKGHGLFTYYILKKIQESKGNVTLGELSDYVKDEVNKQSMVVNSKSQTPTVLAPEEMGDDWRRWTLR